jgi:hypothetical protein
VPFTPVVWQQRDTGHGDTADRAPVHTPLLGIPAIPDPSGAWDHTVHAGRVPVPRGAPLRFVEIGVVNQDVPLMYRSYITTDPATATFIDGSEGDSMATRWWTRSRISGGMA